MTYRFKVHEGVTLALEYKLTPGEPRTHDDPGSQPEVKITEAYIEGNGVTKDITSAIDMVEHWTALPIWETLQERILEDQ